MKGQPTAWLSVVGLVLLSTACSSPSPESRPFETRDSAGVTIAENAAPLFTDTLSVDPTPLFSIPNDFGEPDSYLFGVRGAVQLSGGGFVVGNSGSRELHYFDSEGAFVRTVGGPGEGPGELQRVYALAGCAQDRVAVQEQSRFSVFDADGELVETVRVPGHLADRSASLVGLSPDCASALVVIRSGGPPPDGVTLFEQFFPLYWVHLATGVRDTVGVISALDVQVIELSGRRAGSRQPFGREAVWATSGEDAVLGLARGFELSRLRRGGGPRQVVRWSANTQAVSEEDWRYFVERQEEYRLLNPDEARYMPSEDQWEVPSEKPPYALLVTDDLGRLWVQRYGRFTYFQPEPSTQWWVFAADGRWLATVEMPVGVEVLSISGNRILGLIRDELDVEEIRAFQVPTELAGSG